jgi:drug/metabolite transporter (DMT)-like permease
MTTLLDYIGDVLMLNPLLSDIGWLAEAAGFVIFVLCGGFCLYVERQTWFAPDRLAPYCHMRRFGLIVMGLVSFAVAWRATGHPPTLLQLIVGSAFLTFLVGLAAERTRHGERKPRGNRRPISVVSREYDG